MNLELEKYEGELRELREIRDLVRTQLEIHVCTSYCNADVPLRVVQMGATPQFDSQRYANAWLRLDELVRPE